MNQVLLVDDNDNAIELYNLLEAHQKALLHRAFSIFIFCNNFILIKFNSNELITNVCSGHVINDNFESKINEQIYEEIGVIPKINKIFIRKYQIRINKKFQEKEINHIYIGNLDKKIDCPDNYFWIDIKKLKLDMYKNFKNYNKIFNFIIKDIFEYVEILAH